MNPVRPLRSFEDLVVGEERRSGQRSISLEEILDFARRYDPQWFHADPEAARQSVFGEVVASGIQLMAIWRQLDHSINSDIDFVCGIGMDELRLPCAVRAGDTVHVESRIVELRPSSSNARRGTAITDYAMIKQTGETVLRFRSINLVYTRAARGES